MDALIALEQVSPGRFVRYPMETVTCDHAACDLGDFDSDGKVDLVTGNFLMTSRDRPSDEHDGIDWVVVRRNLGRP